MSNSIKTQDMLEEMKKVTMVSGRVSSVQLQNMKMWGNVVFQNFSKIELTYSLDPNQYSEGSDGNMKLVDNPEFFVAYDVFKKSKVSDENTYLGTKETVVAFLERAIRTMFWDGIQVKVRLHESDK
jgi:hypothetical protein